MKRFLRGLLPDYMIPSMVVPLLTFPLTPNGKVDRAALPDPFVTSQPEVVADNSPVGATEQMLADIWVNVLKVERIGRLDNFFELGGYSLLSLRVAKLVEKRTGQPLDPRLLFFHNLREVAEMLERDPVTAKVGMR
jgi:hypothetical protein